MLGGRDGTVVTLYPLRNVAPQPERQYRADSLDVLRAVKAMRREGVDLAGIYHSHPHGPGHPSEEDVRLARYDVPYLIADVAAGTLRAFLLPLRTEITLA